MGQHKVKMVTYGFLTTINHDSGKNISWRLLCVLESIWEFTNELGAAMGIRISYGFWAPSLSHHRQRSEDKIDFFPTALVFLAHKAAQTDPNAVFTST